ncbi:MAG: HAD-IA family hydrolase [Rhodobacterales bacterium]|nr:HAD-IA family hydrolase [Rhodobacterales bacterium]
MRPGAVLFDCDGVIVDSEPATFDLLIRDLARHGLALTPEQAAREFLGGTIQRCSERARALGADLPLGWVNAFYERLYARLAQGTALVAGIEQVLDALDAAGIPYAVGSNGAPRKMQVTLGQHPRVWARLQARLFSGQVLGRLKPAPDLYLHAAAALGVPPARCVVVEDSPTGARAAAAAGMVCWGYAPHGDAAALVAEGARPFADMAALPRLLGL